MRPLVRIASVPLSLAVLAVVLGSSVAAAQVTDVYKDPKMDFGAIQTVAVLPFANFTRDQVVADRVRDVFINKLLSSEAVYVLPVGEVARGIAKLELSSASAPTTEEVVKLGGLLKTDAVITGAVREYGEVRSGTTTANVISMSIQMLETQTGRVIWSGSATKGGISLKKRLFGGGGEPLNRVTEEAIDALFDKLLGPGK